MRILSFDPYGAMPSQTIQQDSKQHQMTLNQRISDEIAKNEAIRLALLAIADQEKDRKRQQHKFKILNKKQANILLSQLRNLDLDFQHLMHPKAKNKHQEEQKKEKQKRVSFKIAKGKKLLKSILQQLKRLLMLLRHGLLLEIEEYSIWLPYSFGVKMTKFKQRVFLVAGKEEATLFLLPVLQDTQQHTDFLGLSR